jgi:hypothetical protein
MTATRRVVRRLGSEVTHVVDIPVAMLVAGESFGRPFTGVVTPVATGCGSVLRDRTGMVVTMRPGTPVRCRPCRRTTGLEAADEDNTARPTIPGDQL